MKTDGELCKVGFFHFLPFILLLFKSFLLPDVFFKCRRPVGSRALARTGVALIKNEKSHAVGFRTQISQMITFCVTDSSFSPKKKLWC